MKRKKTKREAPAFDPEKRAAKNATVKERNERRKLLRRYEAEQRNAKWQEMTLEQQLAYCKQHGGRDKQIRKILKKMKEGQK